MGSSTTMKAVQIQATGDPSVLQIKEVPIPAIATNEVFIPIKAS